MTEVTVASARYFGVMVNARTTAIDTHMAATEATR